MVATILVLRRFIASGIVFFWVLFSRKGFKGKRVGGGWTVVIGPESHLKIRPDGVMVTHVYYIIIRLSLINRKTSPASIWKRAFWNRKGLFGESSIYLKIKVG
jgi:hypothetical protein